MNREIKFRVWDNFYKVMRYNLSTLYQSDNGLIVGSYYDERNNLIMANDDQFILMQYTGFKDINGKEIYEGDVVNFTKPWKDRNVVIKFYSGSFWLEDDIYGLRLLSDRSACIKVIGNIYENPKLLNEERKELECTQ